MLGSAAGQTELEGLIAKLLDAGADAARGRKLKINDPVWGTCEFAAHETALIDTPLVQRLRGIRQLGGTYAVFPSAVHTRFEHTLGVAHFAGRCAEALQARSAHVDEAARANIRFAALCHDLGHGPFSHSSEAAFGKLDPLPKMAEVLPGISPAEALSWLIACSEPMRKFTETLNHKHGTELDCDFIAGMIVGRLPAAQHYMCEILHGPIDADKIDYLQRDALFAGMPVKLDCDRMLTSIEVAQHTDSNGSSSMRLTASDSGAMAFLQLIQHKAHMHAVVYHHAAVRCFGAMMEAALAAAMRDKTPIGDKPLVCAADLLRLDDSSLLSGCDPASDAGQLLERVQLRKLYKVAYACESENADGLASAIAKQLGLRPEEVLVAKAALPSLSEARTLLLRSEDELQSLGDIFPESSWTTLLKRKLGAHLIICPASKQEQVRTIATGLAAKQ